MNSSVCKIAFNSLDHLSLGELTKILIHNINPTRQNGLLLASTTFIQRLMSIVQTEGHDVLSDLYTVRAWG
jgi:hypothetical protein